MPKQERRLSRSKAAERFRLLRWASGEPPAVLTSHPPLPLMVGIWARLVPLLSNPGDAGALRRALGFYTNGWEYLRALGADGSWRHDFEGSPVEVVSDEHRTDARVRLKTSRRKAAAARCEAADNGQQDSAAQNRKTAAAAPAALERKAAAPRVEAPAAPGAPLVGRNGRPILSLNINELKNEGGAD